MRRTLFLFNQEIVLNLCASVAWRNGIDFRLSADSRLNIP